MSLKTPIAFIIFNRPDLTSIVFERIREIQPEKLFVIADGPRPSHPEDNSKCKATREIIDKGVDWACQVFRDYSKVNLGCKMRPASGLNWVFSQVSEAIVLEDDCLPSLFFFKFCEDLLIRYRSESRIMHISGDNFQGWRKRGKYSYYFSKYSHIWGWATWRRAWRLYDLQLKSWSDPESRKIIDSVFDTDEERKYWTKIFNDTHDNFEKSTAWSYSWLYTCWINQGLSVCPAINLVENIGIGSDSTHTNKEAERLRTPAKSLRNIKHPSTITRHIKADKYTFRYCFALEELQPFKRIYYILKIQLGRIKKKFKNIL